MLSVCSCVSSLKPLNQLTDSHKTLYENHARVKTKSHGMTPSIFYQPTTRAPPVYSSVFKIFSHNGAGDGSNLLECYAVLTGKQLLKCMDFWTHSVKTIQPYKMLTVLN